MEKSDMNSVQFTMLVVVTVYSSEKMTKLSVVVLLCHGLFAVSNVCGTEVKLECPPGYTVNATPIYESKTSLGKTMMCVTCSLKSTNSFEVCVDNGFIYPDMAKSSFEYQDGRFRASPYSFASRRHMVYLNGEFGGGACSASVVEDSTGLKVNKCDVLASPSVLIAKVSWNF